MDLRANYFQFKPNNTEIMRILSSGVGIGTDAPSANLEVYGSGHDNATLKITNAASSNARLLLNSGHGNWSVCNSDTVGDALEFRDESAAATRMIIISSGSVGIGTANPQALFQCYSSAIIGHADQQSTQLTIEALNTAGSPAATTTILMKGYEGRGIGTFYTDSSYSGEEWFCGMNYSGSFNSWNVGFDAAGSQAEYVANTLLQLHYTGKLQLYTYGSGTHTGTLAKSLGVDSSGNVIEFTGGAGTVTGSGTDHYIPRWNGTTALQDSSIIALDNGNVGIGTNNPAQRLHLESATCIVRVVSTTANSNSSIWFNSNVGGTNADRWEFGTNISAGSSLEIYDRLNGASRMVVKNDGNVGIGTNSPLDKLDVYGTGAIFRNLSDDADSVQIVRGTNHTASPDAKFYIYDDSSADWAAKIQMGGASYGLDIIGGVNYFINCRDASGNRLFEVHTSSVVINDGSTDMDFRVEGNGDDYLLFTDGGNDRVAISTNTPAAKLHVEGDFKVGATNNGNWMGYKDVAMNGSSYTTALTISLADHTACHVKLFISGDWSSHSAVAFVGEYFIQNSADGYQEPGQIISEFDNTNTDLIMSKIVDPSSDTFTIQLKLSTTANGSFTGKLSYHVMGMATAVS